MERFISKIRQDMELADKIETFCDFRLDDEILDCNSLDYGMTFNIAGLAFGNDGAGGEYILLDDRTVGFCSSEGQCGRIAENITDFFTLITNCYYYCEYLHKELANDPDKLVEFFHRWEEKSREEFNEDYDDDFDTVRMEIGKALGIPVSEEAALQSLQRLYHCLTIEPQFISYCQEDNGDLSPSEPLI
ncbi:MAG: hypothetical protein Q4G58_10260 [bacterium]|nr:hypothetical protein [bacterium]